MLFRIAIVIAVLSLSACSSWVFRYDIPQGNYLDQKNINKLQVGMTKEQVKFILGSPVVVDTFNDNNWHYVYRLKSGRNKKFNVEKAFALSFVDDKLTGASGDFEVSENFNTPFNETNKEAEVIEQVN
jgi:outer membrane protein assembly factor BamE